MIYVYEGDEYLLNLIDTPGHVDFNYEVSRSLRACEGAILLVDAVKGVQAQTVANFWLAYEANLHIISAINKVDIKTAMVGLVSQQIFESFSISNITRISAKTGLGISTLLDRVIEEIPPPVGVMEAPFRSLLFDSWYGNEWSGVVSLVKVVDGCVHIGDEIQTYEGEKTYRVNDVGIMYPEQASTSVLYTGQVGYITCGMKQTSEALVGDTLFSSCVPKSAITPFPGFKEPKPMVFGGIYPSDDGEFQRLSEAIQKLALTDRAVTLQKDTNDILGLGYKCGFLGMLHMEVFSQRLRQEFGASVITTAPMVTYRVKIAGNEGYTFVTNPSEWPSGDKLLLSEEPILNATIVCPKEYMGPILKLCTEKRGIQQSMKFIDETRVVMKYILPLAELLQKFYDKLKSLSSGYATLDYEEAGYVQSDLVKVTILLNGEPVHPLSIICHKSKAQDQGRALSVKLKETISRQLFEIAIQASVGGKIIARENIKPYRKDVTAKCYGGDITRKRKLLERQKEGKKHMKSVGNVQLSQEAFLSVLNI
eukprot:TRINITY_DN6256_c0_g1_i22.p1 TRINITY_DN6256_c0_g1~~TRINITY_DN6256_c0_g1_i22.p1  ORF type:complete len:537 (-),score=120.40 TRINITY_DN6256_c0_g1_i22:250-1860(-)